MKKKKDEYALKNADGRLIGIFKNKKLALKTEKALRKTGRKVFLEHRIRRL